MKLSILFLLVFFFTFQSYSQKYVKIWSDEFNTPGLPDSTKWDYEVGQLRNAELQYYTYKRSENARIQDTVLILEARKEAYKGAAYTSASLKSKFKGDWTYGKFEIRAKVPGGKGTWPAIWMLPTDEVYGGWPKSGEIDIMEYVGMNPDNLYYTPHFEGINGKGDTGFGTSTTTSQPYSKFITFTLIWTPTKLEWYADNKLCNSYTKTADDPRLYPFNKMFYMILNMAYGGSWGAQQGIDDTKLPHKFLIDYIRVYQLQESTGPFSLNIEPAIGGTVEVSPKLDSYPEGTMVTVTAKPDAGYEFDKWLHVGSANPVTMEILKDITLIPVFKKNELIVNGDFSQGLKNWNNIYFFTDVKPAAIASVIDGVYTMNITKPGTDSWNIVDQQLNIAIEKGTSYLITFDVWADNPNTMEIILARNSDPYTNYFSIVKSITGVKQHFSWTVKMTQASDPNCRFGFGFGKFTGNVYLDNVSIIKQVPTGLEQLTGSTDESFELFPNPANDYLDVTNKSTWTLQPTINIYNLQGQLITNLWKNNALSSGQQIRINLNDLKAGNGLYLVNITTPEKSVTHKLVINRP